MTIDFASALPAISGLLFAGAVLMVGISLIRVRASAGKDRSLALIASSTGAMSAAVSPRHGQMSKEREADSRLHGLEKAGRSVMATIGSTGRETRLLAFAGKVGEHELGALAVGKVVGAGVGIVLGLLWGLRGGGIWWLALPVLTAIGFFVPDLFLVNAAQKRTDEIRRRLPDAIDLLNLCVESGMGFQAALAQVAATQDGPVAEELSRVLREMQLGQSRHDALASLAARTKQEDLLRFIGAMNQVDRLGIPVSAVLREQAKEMRARRRDRARERAQKVPVKIMMPVVFCFFPVLVGIVIAPAAVQIARMFSSF